MTLLRVLIIEDSENHALLLLRALRKGGFEPVYIRVQTEDAMRTALQEETWDLILSNHNMPRFNVFGALKVYQESNLDVPFIIVSGSMGLDEVTAAIKAGAHDFIMKRNLDRLLPIIQRELRQAEKHRKHRHQKEE
jgi:DNA-binding NtrC family response regulator